MPTAAPPEPRPATPLPTAAAATPSTISELPTGRRRHDRAATATTASVPRLFARIASSRAGRNGRWSCAGGSPCVANAPGAGAANAGEEKRADAEQRCREERAGRVVDPEGARVPLRRLAPRDRTGGDRVRRERPRPRGELRPPCLAVAPCERAREAERDERCGEGEKRTHTGDCGEASPPRALAWDR